MVSFFVFIRGHKFVPPLTLEEITPISCINFLFINVKI